MANALLLMVVMGVVIIPLSIMINGFALMKIWNWFMVPTFELPALRLAQSIGIGLLWTTIRMPAGTPKSENPGLSLIIGISVEPALVLATGWVVKTFWM